MSLHTEDGCVSLEIVRDAAFRQPVTMESLVTPRLAASSTNVSNPNPGILILKLIFFSFANATHLLTFFGSLSLISSLLGKKITPTLV